MIRHVPNMLTMSRIIVIPAMIGAFYLDSPLSNWVVFGFFCFASITDYFDGYLARSLNEVTGLGRFLDPVADKLLVAATLLMLVYVDQIADWTILPAVVIMCREIMVSALREYLAELRVGLPVSKLAKWKTLVQMLALSFVIVGDAAFWQIPAREIGIAGLWIAAALTIYTGYDYLLLGLRHMTNDERSENSLDDG
jgi:cardiolipin synthase